MAKYATPGIDVETTIIWDAVGILKNMATIKYNIKLVTIRMIYLSLAAASGVFFLLPCKFGQLIVAYQISSNLGNEQAKSWQTLML